MTDGDRARIEEAMGMPVESDLETIEIHGDVVRVGIALRLIHGGGDPVIKLRLAREIRRLRASVRELEATIRRLDKFGVPTLEDLSDLKRDLLDLYNATCFDPDTMPLESLKRIAPVMRDGLDECLRRLAGVPKWYEATEES